MPFSNDYFTVRAATSPTGRRLRFATEGMPVTSMGAPVDPTKWSVVDGFSVGPMLVTFEQEVDLALSATPPITDFAASLDPDSSYVLLDAGTGERVWESFEPIDLERPTRWGTAFLTPHEDRFFLFTAALFCSRPLHVSGGYIRQQHIGGVKIKLPQSAHRLLLLLLCLLLLLIAVFAG